MPSFCSFLPLFSKLLFSFLLSLFFPLILFPSTSISTFGSSAAVLNTNASTYNYKLLSSTHDPPHQICLHQHFVALPQLKRGFNFSYSVTNLSSWNTNNPNCCSWEGIQCNPFTGYVISLNLSWLYIGGLLNFQSLFQLQSLEKLDLSNNHVSVESPIPSGFSQLSNLTHLHLRWNNFYGQIPLYIFHLTKLISLDLSYNEYYNASKNVLGYYLFLERSSSGMKQLFGNLSGLRELYLDEANLSSMGSQLSCILAYALPNLYKLGLSSCTLYGQIHPSLFQLHSLIMLDLNYNYLSSPLPESRFNHTSLTSSVHLSKLMDFDLPKNEFQGPISIWIFELPELIKLYLSHNKLEGDIPTSIGELKALRVLDLSHNHFQGKIPISLQNLKDLELLDLSYNNLCGKIPW